METRLIDPDGIVDLNVPNYSHGIEIEGAKRWVQLSGQVGVDKHGNTVEGFEGQCRQAFANIKACLEEAGMTMDDVVMLRVFLTHREDLAGLRRLRSEAFGDHRFPSTLLFVSGLVGPDWRVELEVTAAKG